MNVPPSSVPMPPGVQQSGPYSFHAYTFRRRVLVFAGARLDISAPTGQPVFFCQQKAFKLREDIRLYTDQSKNVELLTIKARNIIDFSSAYDVVDAQSGEKVGVLRRKGWKSMLRDTWEVLNAEERLMATIEEDSMAMAMVRRVISTVVDLPFINIPQSFHFTAVTGGAIAKAHQNFNPFVHKMTLEMPSAQMLDPRLVLAATTLLVLIEGRQR